MFISKIELNSKIGITPKTKEILNQEGIISIFDLITLYPKRYLNFSISELTEGPVLVKGVIQGDVKAVRFRNNLNMLSFECFINDRIVKIVIFNRLFLKNRLVNNKTIYISGKYERKKETITASDIYFKLDEGKITPVYKSKADQKVIHEAITASLLRYKDYINDEVPEYLLSRYRLLDFYTCLMMIHNPSSLDDVKEALRRLKFEEFFRFQLKLAYSRLDNESTLKAPKIIDMARVRKFISTIPFELTDDQKEVVNDIYRDMKSPKAANRLVQGDVGSGKTIVAAISLYAVAINRCQSCLMAPTEILARQHYKNLMDIFKDEDIRIELLTSSISKVKRRELLERLSNGDIDILIGTHAVISDDVIFKNLELVITDEQHRFGVNQRQILRKKGNNPDVIYLTATPIPRTLAIGLFADLDISSIRTMPKGRSPIKTKVINNENLKPVFNFINDEIKHGHQAYIIAPLITESDKIDLHDVNNVYEMVKEHFDCNIGLMHGKLKDNEKDAIMQSFVNNEIQILVSTTVIEVGIDNKNASVILILDAERFGLSQLHQLRGRVGRGNIKSYCFLSSTYEEIERLKIMEETTDGFRLSEEDLRLRGPGDFFGNKQSGMPEFKLVDIVKDYKILEVAKKEATYIINNNLLKKYKYLYEYIKNEFDNSSILD